MSLQLGSQWPGGNPPFMQQGTVDWVAFGKTIWKSSSAVLQRFAAAGIQPATHGAGIALSSQMCLDRVGQSRMEKAIGSLNSIFGLRKVLWFGFGYQSFVHTMADSLAGIKCLAVCSCLAEAHTEVLAAWVLSELWRVSAFPEVYEPSHAQFLALVKASAGVISQTEFSSLLDKMLGNQLWRLPVGTNYSESEVDEPEHDGVLEASNAKDIASALHRLFQISRGEAEYMVVNGGSECAFIAAFASWLLNLRVKVENSSGGILFDDTMAGGHAQVFVRYGQASNDSVQVAGTTYILGSCRDIIGRIPNREDFHLIVRTPWHFCLSRVFGSKFMELSKLPHVLGDYLGGVARVYEALATGASNVANLSRTGFIYFSETSYGHGFVDTVLSTFPELENMDGLRDRMLHIASKSFDDAIRCVETSVLGLESLCSCECCSQEFDDSVLLPETSRTCIVGVAYAIRRIALVMSYVVQDFGNPGLLPAVNGIHEFSALGKESDLSNGQLNRPLVNGRETINGNSKWTRASFYWNALGLHHDQPFDTSFNYHPLSSPALLFQGSRIKSEKVGGISFTDPNTCTALSRRGICCFIEALRVLSPQAETVCKVHVLPGHIQSKGRPYEFVHDGMIYPDPNSASDGNSGRDHATLQQPSTDVPDFSHNCTFEDIQALATERSSESSLTYVYRISTLKRPIYISPGRLTQIVLNNSGLIACDSRGCRSGLAFPCSVVNDGWTVHKDNQTLTYVSGTACCIWTYHDEFARCVAIASNTRLSGSGNSTGLQMVLLRRNECLPCSTRSILQLGGKMQTARKNRKDELPRILFHIV